MKGPSLQGDFEKDAQHHRPTETTVEQVSSSAFDDLFPIEPRQSALDSIELDFENDNHDEAIWETMAPLNFGGPSGSLERRRGPAVASHSELEAARQASRLNSRNEIGDSNIYSRMEVYDGGTATTEDSGALMGDDGDDALNKKTKAFPENGAVTQVKRKRGRPKKIKSGAVQGQPIASTNMVSSPNGTRQSFRPFVNSPQGLAPAGGRTPHSSGRKKRRIRVIPASLRTKRQLSLSSSLLSSVENVTAEPGKKSNDDIKISSSSVRMIKEKKLKKRTSRESAMNYENGKVVSLLGVDVSDVSQIAGRAPIAAEPGAASQNVKLPKRRGRPPKAFIVVSEVDRDDSPGKIRAIKPGRKIGRPRKQPKGETDATADGDEEEPIPKRKRSISQIRATLTGRGYRRKRSVSRDVTDKGGDAAAGLPTPGVVEPKRGPGRPRKSESGKRGPGRPRKKPLPGSTKAIESTATSVSQLPPPSNSVLPALKRGRGRPRKNPLPEASQAIGSKASKPHLPAPSNDVGPVKRGPGRPRKNPLPEASQAIGSSSTSIPQLPANVMGPMKGGRGRPRKNSLPEAALQATVSTVISVPQLPAPSNGVGTVKRGPGRQRKNPPPGTTDAIKVTAKCVPQLPAPLDIVEPVKRGRGRPRKNPLSEALQAIGSTATSIPRLPEPTNVMGPVKRGHGRPPKNPLPDAALLATGSAVMSVPQLPAPFNGMRPVNRGPGRPRKNPLPRNTQAFEVTAPCVPQLPSPSTVVEPVKRGRGRPRKVLLTTTRNTEFSKRCSGRPRKYPLPAASRSSGSAKRGPRRPRKHSLHGSSTVISLSGRVTRQSRQRKLPIYLHDFVIVDDGGEVKQQYDAIVPGRSEAYHRPGEPSEISVLGEEDDSVVQMPTCSEGPQKSPFLHPSFAEKSPEQSYQDDDDDDDDDVKNGLKSTKQTIKRRGRPPKLPMCRPKTDPKNETSGAEEQPTQRFQESTAVIAKGGAKRGGRPRKDGSQVINVDEAAVDRPTKKRGRPPKNSAPNPVSVSIDEASLEPSPKKRRGRPLKSSFQKSGDAPTNSGDRPSKRALQDDIAPTEDEGNQSQPTKRRGRPRKLPLCMKEDSTNTDSSDGTKQLAKKSGRPPENCLQKVSTVIDELKPPPTKRGHPPKQRSTHNVEALKQPQKRRGHPPKNSYKKNDLGRGNEEKLATRKARLLTNPTVISKCILTTQRSSATEELPTIRRTSRRQSIPTDFYVPGFDELLQKSMRKSQKKAEN